MTCREVAEFLMAYLEQDLHESERQVFDSHLEACPACVHYLDSYRETVRLGRELCRDDDAPAEVPEELVQAILSARAQPKR